MVCDITLNPLTRLVLILSLAIPLFFGILGFVFFALRMHAIEKHAGEKERYSKKKKRPSLLKKILILLFSPRNSRH